MHIVLKPNQIYNLARGGLVTCISGKIRIVQQFSNIVYTFETISPNNAMNVKQDITNNYVVNTNSTTSSFSLEE
jgi:hypothetical protein